MTVVNGNLLDIIGGVPSQGRIWFLLSRPNWNEATGQIFVPEFTQVIANVSTGAFTIDLEPTVTMGIDAVYYAVLKYMDTTSGKEKEYTVGSFAVPSTGGPYQLSDLLVSGPFLPVPEDILASVIAYAAAAAASAAAITVTQTAVDTTAGRLTKVGDFGLGGIGDAITLANLDDKNTPAGQYRTIGTTTGVFPSGASVFGYITIIRYDTSNISQTYTPVGNGGGANSTFTRTYNSFTSAWMPWRQVFNQGNILGTVTQTAGVPTGAVMQHSSSANGFFERRASGRAVCTRMDQTTPNVSTAYGSLFRSADIVWTFPTAFFAGTLPAVSFSADNADVIGFRVSALSATAVTFQLVANASISGTTTVRASAIGRWSNMA